MRKKPVSKKSKNSGNFKRFSTIYTTLPHDLIKNQLVDMIESTFMHEKVLYWPAMKSEIFCF